MLLELVIISRLLPFIYTQGYHPPDRHISSDLSSCPQVRSNKAKSSPHHLTHEEDRRGQERTGGDKRGQEGIGRDRTGQERIGGDREPHPFTFVIQVLNEWRK